MTRTSVPSAWRTLVAVITDPGGPPAIIWPSEIRWTVSQNSADLAVVVIHRHDRTGGQQLATLDVVLAEVVQEDRLIGEGVGRVPGQVIEGEKVLIQKARRAG